jgi:hypothetical protein
MDSGPGLVVEVEATGHGSLATEGRFRLRFLDGAVEGYTQTGELEALAGAQKRQVEE